MTLVFFDLDNTLVRGNMSVQFGLFLLRRGLFSRWKLIATMGVYSLFSLGIVSFENMQQRVFQILFKGQKAEGVYKEAVAFCAQVFDTCVRPEIVSELQQFQQEGATVAILSSSPDFIVTEFAKRFGVEQSIASSYLVNSQGEFEVVAAFRGIDKAKALKLFPGHRRTVAFSDSMADISLLNLVDVPVVVSPDRALLKHARKQGWRII